MNFKLLFVLILLISAPGCLKKSSGLPAPTKNITAMTLEEAQHAASYYQETAYDDLTIKALERVITLSTDHEISAQALLKLADTYVKAGMYEKAQNSYKEFITLYPGNAQVAYAAYQEIIAHYKEVRPAYRDQQKTRDVIALAEQYEENYPHTTYIQHIHEMRDTAYKLLLEHEVMVVQFYLTKYQLEHSNKSAISCIKRLEYIKKDIIPHIANKKDYSRTITLINRLLDTYNPQKLNNIEELVSLIDTITQNFYDILYADSLFNMRLLTNVL